MKRCKCPSKPKVKSVTYHAYIKLQRNTVELVRQENTFDVPKEWAKTKKQALDNILMETLDAALAEELAHKHYKEEERFGLIYPYTVSRLDVSLRNQKILDEELRVLLTGNVTMWKD